MRHSTLARVLILTVVLLAWALGDQAGASRLKDVASVYGTRDNQLIGYGLVVGLNGSGDGNNTKFTVQTVVNMLERLGIHVPANDVKVKNVAAVMVTAKFPAFARAGTKLDVTVSSLGDATSLQGGTLLLTPLRGVDSQVYAAAQGPLTIGGFAASGASGSGVQKNHPTAGRIPEGAIVERELPYRFSDQDNLVINLYHADFTTATRTAAAINQELKQELATAVDAATVKVAVPEGARGDLVGLVAHLEQVEITPDAKAKVILDERTGTVVMGENVRISTVAVAHGNLSIQIKETQNVSQPAPFSNRGRTVVTPESDVQASEGVEHLILVEQGASLGDVVRALNAVGASPRDLISILQALKAAGALQADLEVI